MTPNEPVLRAVLEDRLRFEAMLADLSSRFVKVSYDGLDAEIEDAQRRICEHLGLDLSSLWLWSAEDPLNFSLTHLYRPLGGPPVPEVMDAGTYFPWSQGQLVAGRVVAVASMEELPPEADRDRETWSHFGIKTSLGIPLMVGGEKPIGLLSFNSMLEERTWPDSIVRRLVMVAEIYANALARKRADVALRDSEERLQLAAESAGVGMWMLDVASGRFWVSDRGRELFGYAADVDITMALFVDSVHPEFREPVEESVRRALEENCGVDVEYRIVLPVGGTRWVHSRGRMQPASEGRPVRLLGVSMDVTERKGSEEALRQAYEDVERLKAQLEMENLYLKREQSLIHGSGRVVGESPAILEVLALVEQVAPTGSTVLIEGETGTGKELIAQRIHDLSPRRERPLVKVNCAALPSTLVESELFGREKGAYTGAVSREAGRFEIANGSSILLDEISELPLELQAKLLRVLEDGRFERVGSSRTLLTDVRVIAATNRDLLLEAEEGRFRRDLYYRLAVFPIRVPPLRERRDDVPLLVWSMVDELSGAMGKPVENIRRQDMERLKQYDWPGNVRELRNVVERAMILCAGPSPRIEPPIGVGPAEDETMSLDEIQRRHIGEVLDITGGRISGPCGAADLLGVKPTTLRSKMERLGLEPRKEHGGRSST
jgi:PAS domain S-box-containing protein